MSTASKGKTTSRSDFSNMNQNLLSNKENQPKNYLAQRHQLEFGQESDSSQAKKMSFQNRFSVAKAKKNRDINEQIITEEQQNFPSKATNESPDNFKLAEKSAKQNASNENYSAQKNSQSKKILDCQANSKFYRNFFRQNAPNQTEADQILADKAKFEENHSFGPSRLKKIIEETTEGLERATNWAVGREKSKVGRRETWQIGALDLDVMGNVGMGSNAFKRKREGIVGNQAIENNFLNNYNNYNNIDKNGDASLPVFMNKNFGRGEVRVDESGSSAGFLKSEIDSIFALIKGNLH